MVEAKRLGEGLKGAVSQGIQYCLERGTQHFAVTDGQRWELYETHRPVPIEQKKVASFDIVSDGVGAVCLEALALWRPGVDAGNVQAGREPVFEWKDEPPSTPGQSAPTHFEPEFGPEWKSLATLDVRGLKESMTGSATRPLEVAFADGSRAQIKFWWEVTFSIAKWLVESQFLTESHCPVTTSKGGKYLIAASPFQPNGSPMYNHKGVGNLHVEVHRSARASVRHAKAIIQHVGQDPSQFRLRFP